ncbi:MAG: glycine/sarcosine/betaine reductase selenoprotein B family protein [Pseudomonadota bacterium]
MIPSTAQIKNRLLAKLLTSWPRLGKAVAGRWASLETRDIPWAPLARPLKECTVALVTTAGVHPKGQSPFNMLDPRGDPSFRKIPDGLLSDLMITHDYYDHKDADRDLNIVLPLERLHELAEEGIIGRVAPHHYGFMGHITGPHVTTLIEQTAPEVARRMSDQGVQAVVLTPG